MFNLKDPKGIETFKTNTSNTEDFSECFMTAMSVESEAADWMKLLMTHCTMTFLKILKALRNLKLVT